MLPEIAKTILHAVFNSRNTKHIIGQLHCSAENISETQLQCASDMTSLQSGFLTFLAPLGLFVAVPGSVALLTAALLPQLAAVPHLPAPTCHSVLYCTDAWQQLSMLIRAELAQHPNHLSISQHKQLKPVPAAVCYNQIHCLSYTCHYQQL